MIKRYTLFLIILLLVTVSMGVYFGVYRTEYFAASDGGALIQLATSHVPTREEMNLRRRVFW
jgi:hypothetical protein